MATNQRLPVLGQFQDIGENVVEQVKQLPGDMVGKALESVGMNVGSGKKQQTTTPQPGATGEEGSAYNQIDQTPDTATRKEIARKALEELTRPSQKQKEPSIWEKIMKEEEQKKEMAKQNKPKSVALPSSGARKVPGIKSSVKSKQSSEINKNVKQD